eukprot:Lankesteria_metandrocarpae@DN3322_c0_g1_i1.p1
MGIKGLTRFLTDYAPSAVKVQDLSSLLGRTVAVDASMSLYQFMVAIRDSDTFGNLTNEAGETTSHISGMLSRVVRLLEKGIRPAYVFDGKPPVLKGGELAKRQHRRTAAESSLKEAQETGDIEGVKKMIGRTVRVTKQHNDDVKELLRLLGVPVIQAPGEAEAQCAKLCSTGQVYATATEDADALTFGSSILVRHLSFTDRSASTGNKTVTKNGVIPGKQILVLNLEAALLELGFTYEQFVDFCILCGCDYCDTIKGIGPSTAFKLMKDHTTLENVIASLETTKHTVPQVFPYSEARHFFLQPEITDPKDLELKWCPPNFEELRVFLVDKHSFDATRIDNYFKRLRSSQGTSSQTRLESFFGGGMTKGVWLCVHFCGYIRSCLLLLKRLQAKLRPRVKPSPRLSPAVAAALKWVVRSSAGRQRSRLP